MKSYIYQSNIWITGIILLALSFSSFLSGQAASSLFPDITEFKVEFPLDNNGNDYEGVDYDDRDDPHIKNEIEENLGGYVAPSPYNQYFFVQGNELVMRAHCAGALTSVNAYPRCELRQQINGNDSFWDFSDEHELNVTLKITELPNEKEEVCVVQIKGTDTPNTTSGTEEVLRVEYRADGSSGWHLEVNEASGPSNVLSYSLGQTVSIRAYVNNGNVTLEMENLSNGATYNYNYAVDSDYTHGYFKAGAYTQSSIWKEKNGTGVDEDPDARSEVRFSQIVLGEATGGPTCTPQVPSNRSVSNVAQTSATISWSAVPNVLNYDVRWKPTSSSSWIYNTNYTSTSLNVSGLSSSTQYEWQVKSTCSDGTDTNYSQGPGPNFTTNSNGGGTTFTPDPTKNYYIDVPVHNLRIGATGASEDGFTTSTTTTGDNVEWKFVAKGNGYWHVQRSAGGTKPRLRTDNSANADMQATSSSGTYTYYEFAQGSSSGTWFMTLPNGPANYKRLQVNNSGQLKFVTTSSNGTWESFTFTEVSSGGGCTASIPTNRQVGTVTNSSASVSWNSTGADNYDVRYKKVVDTDWNYNDNNTGTSTTITGIVEETTYEWQVRSQCDSGGTSSWSSGQGPNFTTDGNGGGGSQNLALDGTASQSSTAHSGIASRAIDNNTAGNWSSGTITHTNNQSNAWWEVDLDQTSDIDQIVLWNRTDNCCVSRLSNYTVKVLSSNGSIVWEQFYGSAPTPSQQINLTETGKKVRIELDGVLSLAEVQVFGTYSSGGGGNGNCDAPWSTSNFTVSDEVVNYSSGIIDISCVSNACISVDLEGVGSMESSDYLNVYYKVNGGSNQALSLNTDSFSEKTEEQCGINGNTFEIIIQSATSVASEIYYISNLVVYEQGTGRVIASGNINSEIDISTISPVEDDNISPEQDANDWSLYPNPASNEIIVEGLKVGEKIQLYNMHGQLVLETQDQTISIGHLQSGIYFVRSLDKPLKRFVKL